ncbi:OmpA family protein [Sphingosinicella soli]|uniref:Outer membrane protein OmpA-like peptidoglycan-associated protein n=1 Tax=Sphingosinicella soli TaxID=333708 RepID=A0A7W7F7S5_9SPHN|nr:OmpA family protein [Sphingosinicella soli]MBB4632974.1 outer membrane protein OmpA-like peptidoglycan-associated protein [Sphingosinicella soli]
MSIQSKMVASVAAAGLLLTTACVTNPETGKKEISKTAIGAALGAGAGAGLGAIIGGKRNRTEVLVGTGIGALAGAAVGAYMDKQEKELREKTAGTGIDVVRQGDEILLNMPSQVTFDVDSAIVNPQFQPTLNEVARVLSQYEKTFVDVIGHTDSTGSDAYNMTLSQRRADSVATYMSSNGVLRARIATQGLGESQPIASNDSETGRAQNRRVEIKLVPVTETATS